MRRCRHFGECGGCSFQDVPYGEQVKEKERTLKAASEFAEAEIIPSEKIYGFRNKMEYSFESDSLGLHPRGRFSKVVDLEECPVFSEWVGSLLSTARKFASEKDIEFYGRMNRKGTLRYLILRESKFTGEKMVILVVNGSGFPYGEEWAETIEKSVPGLKSAVLGRRHTSGDSALTEDYEILRGGKYIRMMIGDLELDVSPYSFFQPNSYQVENLYRLISERIEGPCRILDLYSGIGSIPFFLDGQGRDITGVEAYPSCTRDAVHNLEKIGPSANINFVTEGVKSYAAGLREREDFHYVIVDPPRGGMSYRIWVHLNRFAESSRTLRKVFYVCCSLKNLQQDTGFIRENTKWKMVRVTGVDQFVHTPHLETVVEYDVK